VRYWWLIGTAENKDWGWAMFDTANQFVAEAFTGGILTLFCFIALITIAFSRVGRARRAVAGDRRMEWYFWSLGVSLFAHFVAFFGVSYFDQSRVIWFALLAMISAGCAPALRPSRTLEVSTPLSSGTSRSTDVSPVLKWWSPSGVVHLDVDSKAGRSVEWFIGD
jgi:hypothetical protein